MVQFLKIFCIDDHVICEERQFSFFPISILTFFSYLNALASTSSVILKRSGERGHSGLLPEKTSSFSPLSMVFIVGFLRYSLSNLGSYPLFLAS